MSHKTEIDGFSGHQIHPGHGRIHVREDKHMMTFESRKTYRMWSRKRNPRKIAWTEHFRFDHKKSNTDKVENEGRVRRQKVNRGYAGVAINGQQVNVQKAVRNIKNQRRGGKTQKK